MVDTRDADGGHRAAFESPHQHATQGVAKCGGLASLKRTDQEHACLGAIFGYLMLDAIDLILQHGLMRE
jgi:hypothetical protein